MSCRHVIITRFSVRLTDHHFQKNVNLFSEERMKHRLKYFKDIYLEGLKAQKPVHPRNSLKEHDYTVILLIDQEIPPIWKETLENIIAGYKNIFTYTWKLGEDNINDLTWLRSFMPELFDKEYLIQTRLDDDDTFTSTGIDQLHYWCDRIIRWTKNKKRVDERHQFLTFPDGNYMVDHACKKGNYHVKKQRARCSGAGLTLINKSERNNCIYQFDHSRITTNEQLRIFEKMLGTPMYVVTAHHQNDSNRFNNLRKKLVDFEHFEKLEEAVRRSIE